MKINVKKISKFFMYILLLIPFFKPIYISDLLPLWNQLYDNMKIIAFALLLLYSIKKIKISKINIVLCLSQLILVLITTIKNGNTNFSIDNLISTFTICTIIEHGLENNTKVFLKAFITLFEIYIMINFMTMIAYPNGAYLVDGARFWFLGSKNTTILYILPMFFLIALYKKNYNKRYNLWDTIIFMISIFQLVHGWSATGITGITIFLIGLLFSKKLSNYSYLNLKNYLVIYLVFFFFIIVFRLQNMFSYIIVNLLNKDMTFTGRIYIWDYILNCIKQSPLFGYGIEYSQYRFSKQGSLKVYSHNQLLEFLYQGGLLYIISIVFAFLIIIKKLKKNRSNKCYFIISWTIFTYLIMMLTEYYNFSLWLYILVFAYHIDLIRGE